MKRHLHTMFLLALGSLAWLGDARVTHAFEPMVSQIAVFGSNFCPRGWMETKGQLLKINENQALYSLLGTTYGGDGRTNFALPNLPSNQTGSGAPVICIATAGIFPSRN